MTKMMLAAPLVALARGSSHTSTVNFEVARKAELLRSVSDEGLSSLILLQTKQERHTGGALRRDDASLFRRDAEDPDWHPGPDELMFVHIPKNAGSVIEEESARHKIWWPRKWLSFWHGVKMPDNSFCEKYHVPPQYLAMAGEPTVDSDVFKVPGTFCITRHPYERAVSEYKYMLMVDWGESMSNLYGTGLLEKPKCTQQGLNHFLQQALQKSLEGHKFIHDCHLVPQVDFIWGADGYQWCNNILRHDELPGNFNSLMASKGYNPRLQDTKDAIKNNSTSTCPGLDVDALWPKTKRLLNKVYHEDFRRLNYTKYTKDVVYLDIPRNAGQSIKTAGEEWFYTIPTAWPTNLDQANRPARGSCHRNYVPPRYLGEEDQEFLSRRDVFCSVDHPYERAISLYTTMLEWTEHSSKGAGNVSLASRASMDGLDSSVAMRMTVIKNAPCSEHGLNGFLNSALLEMKHSEGTLSGQEDTFMLGCHMIPQAEFIWGKDGHQFCQNLLTVDDTLPKQFDDFMVKSGLPDVQFGTDPVRSSRTICPKLNAESIDDENKELIQALYSDDFVKLGFKV